MPERVEIEADFAAAEARVVDEVAAPLRFLHSRSAIINYLLQGAEVFVAQGSPNYYVGRVPASFSLMENLRAEGLLVIDPRWSGEGRVPLQWNPPSTPRWVKLSDNLYALRDGSQVVLTADPASEYSMSFTLDRGEVLALRSFLETPVPEIPDTGGRGIHPRVDF